MAEMFPHTPEPSLAAQAPPGSFSWWSWRPGMSPVRALLVGMPLMLLGFACIATGLYALISGFIAPITSSPVHPTSAADIFAAILGLLLLPYPLFLTFSGWYDLRARKCTVTGKIIALRTTATDVLRSGRSARPGVARNIGRAWYGMALILLDANDRRTVMIFRLSEEQYRNLREGEYVRVVYTPHLHHVQALRQAGGVEPAQA